jgi:hypothetical protein
MKATIISTDGVSPTKTHGSLYRLTEYRIQ